MHTYSEVYTNVETEEDTNQNNNNSYVILVSHMYVGILLGM